MDDSFKVRVDKIFGSLAAASSSSSASASTPTATTPSSSLCSLTDDEIERKEWVRDKTIPEPDSHSLLTNHDHKQQENWLVDLSLKDKLVKDLDDLDDDEPGSLASIKPEHFNDEEWQIKCCVGQDWITSADILSKVESTVGNSDTHLTRVLFCGPHFPASHNYTREYLQKYPFVQVDDVPLYDVPNVIEKYHMCVVKNMKLDSNVLSRATQMKLVMQYGVGVEGIDINAATKYGIKVARIPGDVTGNAASCAEMAIYLMMGLLRKQNEMQIVVRQRKLGEPVGETLLGKTVFILGFGNIGIDLAKRLRAFGVKIIATKRSWGSYSQDSCQTNVHGDLVDEKGGHEDIHKFASNADIIVCCLSLNRQTAGIVNETFISSMRKGALLVNIARGGLLDYEVVLNHLKSGHLGGLGIDVAWTEPFDPDDPILKFKNVIITPHVAGVTEHSYRSMAKVVGDVSLQLHAGASLTGIEFVN